MAWVTRRMEGSPSDFGAIKKKRAENKCTGDRGIIEYVERSLEYMGLTQSENTVEIRPLRRGTRGAREGAGRFV